MRTLTASLLSAQKARSTNTLVKIVLTQGVNSYTYTRSRIKSINHSEESFRQTAEVTLDNSDQTFTSLNLKGYKGVLSFGFVTSTGEEYSACAPLYVISHQLFSWPGGLQCVLSLAGIPNLLDGDRANGEYTPTDEDIKTVKDLLTEIIKAVLPARANSTAYVLDALVIPAITNGYTYKCTTAGTTASSAPTWPTTIGNTVTDGTVVWTNQGKELTQFSHATAWTPTFDSEDALIDVFMPKDSFALNLNSSRLDAIKRLLEYTNCMMRVEDDEEVHIFVPTTTGTTYNSEYSLVTGEHNFFDKTLRQRLVIPNYIVVKSQPAHSTQYSGFAEDTESSALIPKRQYVYARLASSAQATSVATALLDRYKLEAETGAAKVLMNVGTEVYDYIKVTDSRENDNRIGNTGTLTRTYRPGDWSMEFRFGTMEGRGQLGTAIPDINKIQQQVMKKGEVGAREEGARDKGVSAGALTAEFSKMWKYIDWNVQMILFTHNWINSILATLYSTKNATEFISITEPATPDSGSARLYLDRTTGKLYKKNSDGTIVDLEDCGVMTDLIASVINSIAENSLDSPDLITSVINSIAENSLDSPDLIASVINSIAESSLDSPDFEYSVA